ncbi:MAG: hypothetical protein HW407_2248 [Bacteroidetes bacterium]|nr:hypothetical protein [Bacteroidota bacterium]
MNDFVRMVRGWLSGRYRVTPWRSVFVLLLVAVYAINPFDFIPDWLPVIGVIDDAAMVGFLIRSLRKDVEEFREWEGLAHR